MKNSQFSPSADPNIQTIKDYSEYRGNPAVRDCTDAMLAAFQGRTHQVFEQTSWMGRGCYTQIESGAYVLVKGTGPCPASEEMRKFLDDLWQKRATTGIGGCTRLDTGTTFPLLVQYQKQEDGWKAMDPRAEGFAIFGALYREAESGEIYKDIGVPGITPVQLWRNKVTPPWKDIHSPEGVQEFIRSKLPARLAAELGITVEDINPIRFEEVTYFDMDGGSLIRTAKTPYRIANMHDAAIEGNMEELALVAGQAIEQLQNMNLGELDTEDKYKLASVLGASAGKMIKHHVIHGQMNIHYQNVSTLGELGDFDSSVFFEAYPDLEIAGHRIQYQRSDLYKQYWNALRQGESDTGIVMLPFLKEDFRRFTSPISGDFDSEFTASQIIGQIYDLYNQASRGVDLLTRAEKKINPQTGSILSDQEFVSLRRTFAQGLTSELDEESKMELERVWKEGKEAFVDQYLDRIGKTTIYGWGNSTTPINHMFEKCDASRMQYIREDALSLFEAISLAQA